MTALSAGCRAYRWIAAVRPCGPGRNLL